jgi:predicted sugar kinase
MKPKTDFKPFKVGTVFNPIKGGPYKVKPKLKEVKIKYPSRLNLMAIDPSKIATNRNLVYTPGEIILKVKIYKQVLARISNNQKRILISPIAKRPSLILHSALLMKKALNFNCGLELNVDNSQELRHVGLGSSSGLIASVACAINELFGKPISPENLLQYLAQNHGEEIENQPNFLSPVQCIGGSAASGLYKGALLVLAGQSRVIRSMNLNGNYQVIIGIPKDFKEMDSKTLLKKELNVMNNFIKCGKKYGPLIAYKVLHSVLPAMVEEDLATIGDVVFDYRYKMGSIKNCSYTYPKLVSLTNRLAFLKTKRLVDLLSISSVGPAIIAVSKDIGYAKEAFIKENLKVFITRPENSTYKILKKVIYEV